MKKKNKIILIIALTIVVIMVLRNSNNTKDNIRSIESNKFKSKIISSFLHKASQEINKMCPMFVDKDTRLDNTIVLTDKTIQYNYTLVNLTKKSLNVDDLKQKFIPFLLKGARTNPGLKLFRDRKVTLSYYYRDKNGEFIFDYKITPNLYK
jgi:hypothetical protein